MLNLIFSLKKGEEMNNKILSLIIQQYEKETGLRFTSYEDKTFSKWLVELKDRSLAYQTYLMDMGINIDTPYCAEVDKCVFDSIAKENTTIISPYGESMNKENSTLILTPKLMVNNSNGIYQPDIDMLLTVNPYHESLVDKWYKVHNARVADICIGFHGKKTDKDKVVKEKIMHKISSYLDDEQSLTYETINDYYFMTLASEREDVNTKKHNRCMYLMR